MRCLTTDAYVSSQQTRSAVGHHRQEALAGARDVTEPFVMRAT